jgi:hypothetical protein
MAEVREQIRTLVGAVTFVPTANGYLEGSWLVTMRGC